MVDILHIVSDEKFIDEMIYFMNDVGGQHLFVCSVTSKPYKFQYIKSNLILAETNAEIKKRIEQGEFRTIMFHYLQAHFYNYVKLVSLDKKIIWSAWGGDLYEKTYFRKPILPIRLWKPLTIKLLRSYSQTKETTPRIIKNFIKDLLNIDFKKQRYFIQRIDYCATVLPIEYDMLKRRFNLKAIYLPFQYVNLKQEISFTNVTEKAEYLLIGNSSDATNNHLDIMSIINKRHITNPLYIPLAYGDLEYCEHLFPYLKKENITLQTCYMSKKDYSQKLSQCRVAIFGHLRQQALYNVNLMLMQGSKVFFFKDSMTYQFYKQMGAYVFNIEDNLNQQEIDTMLTEKQKNTNRQIISSMWDYDNVKKNFIVFAHKEHIL